MTAAGVGVGVGEVDESCVAAARRDGRAELGSEMTISRVIQGDSGWRGGGHTERLTALPERGVEF